MKNILKLPKFIFIGVGVASFCYFAFIIFFLIFGMDLSQCRETDVTYQIEHGYVEKEIGQLFAQMYAKEFDLKSSEVITYKQLASTTSDFRVGHVYLKTPEGIYYACGWYK